MRVIAGTCRSLNLKAPKGDGTRPTLDRIRETLFNMIQNEVPGSVFVDLFAGSGAVGIEALSRGAVRAYFLENRKDALSCINENLAHCRLTDKGVVLSGDAVSNLSLIREKEADVIFADPPYDLGVEDRLFASLYEQPFVTDRTLLILEASRESEFSFPGFEPVKEKIYKTNKHLFYRKTGT